jgi:hypothetical protein
LDKDISKKIMIQGMRDDYLDMLNLMGKWDISKEPLDEIIYLCLRNSRGSLRSRTQAQDTTTGIKKSTNGGVTRVEISNLFDNFKTDILRNLTTQLDVLQVKEKQVEVKKALAVFFPKCKDKHACWIIERGVNQ